MPVRYDFGLPPTLGRIRTTRKGQGRGETPLTGSNSMEPIWRRDTMTPEVCAEMMVQEYEEWEGIFQQFLAEKHIIKTFISGGGRR